MQNKKDLYNTFNPNHIGLNSSSLVKALNMSSQLNSSLFNSIPQNMPANNSFSKKIESMTTITSKAMVSPLTSSLNQWNQQKSYLANIGSLKYRQSIKPFWYPNNSELNAIKGSYTSCIANSLSTVKYSQFTKDIQTSMEKYQMLYKNSNTISTLPRSIFNPITKDQIMYVADQYRNLDFRIPNLTKTILDKVESKSTVFSQEPPKEIISSDPDTYIEKDYPSVNSLAFTKTLFSFYKANKSKELSEKILINGKLVSLAEFLHNYPKVIGNIIFVCLLAGDVIAGVGILEETIKILFDFINWLLLLK
ncbi:hypothetical protein [Lactobacillus apis]|uniref:hypothetical protein n=1 Tax=Lactobacillus apis TaxID=303541 RepID=UPI00242D5B22|nr:hypothetical protein [Lactobacillus apis]